MRFAIARIDDDVGAPLVTALLADLVERYGVEDPDEPAADELAPPRGTFLVAFDDEEPLGCGGIRHHDGDTAELKRMYVDPRARRRGVARALLEELERCATDLGYTRIRLETGVRQPEAIALYLSAGYEPIEPYGYYGRSPLSRCFEKELRGGGEPPRR
jgi:GNAT superfamily N-acetyltransferase